MLCDRCGRANPDGFRFCGACGAPLTASDATGFEQERKVVSALFCDLVGFTSRAEVMDPEDVHGLLRVYYASVRSEFERFGGTVAKFIGDAVFVLFGAPRAHEDDPERAVRAALAGVRRRGEAQRRPSRARPPRPHRRDDRRGAHHLRPAARRERWAGLGRHPQHRRAPGGGGDAGHHPRRRRDLPRDAPRHRVRAGRAHPRQGQGRARSRCGSRSRRGPARAWRSERPRASRWSAVAPSSRSCSGSSTASAAAAHRNS